MDPTRVQRFVDTLWDDSIIPELVEYIRIPNKSPHFDADWAEHGYMEDAVAHMVRWVEAHPVAGMQLEVVRLEGRTPLIFIDIPGDSDDCVLLYGHLDKQPEMTGWRDDLGPWIPKIEDDKLYGRGGADDGYAIYASIAALLALAEQGVPRARCVVIIEACEESGSYDLPYYIDALSDRIGQPSLVVCLDSGCGNYDQLWCTTSLRGLVAGTLTIDVLTEGVHSGDAGGVVPSTFRIARQLLSRLEDETTGTVVEPSFRAQIPAARIEQAKSAAATLQRELFSKFPWADGVGPISDDQVELVLNRTWRPALEITGADGLPPLASAGNVARPRTALKLSLRIPPIVDAMAASERLQELLESNPPHGAIVRFEPEAAGPGWEAPAVDEWLDASMQTASRAFFGREAVYMGEGGSIPFMGMLGEKFPHAQFLITGVLGPQSNAHGPNEFLHLPTGKRLTACVAQVLKDHFEIAP